MAITSLDTYISAKKNKILYAKQASRGSIAGALYNMFEIAGYPGAGTLGVGNTANGLVHTSATTGYPLIPKIAGTGYITKVDFINTVQSMLLLYDRLFVAGAYAFNANVTLSDQPSYADRIPDADYRGTELWIEAVTAFTGNLNVTITYTNQSGVAGKSTGLVNTTVAPTVGRAIRIPLASGDTGVQKIESVVSTVSTAGTFNVMVLRPMVNMPVLQANLSGLLDLTQTGMPVIYENTALYPIIQTITTNIGTPVFYIEVADG